MSGVDHDNARQWAKIDALCENMTKVQADIAYIKGKLDGSGVGAPIHTPTAAQATGIMDAFNNKNGPFYMAIVSIVIAVANAISSSIMGSK